MRRRRFPRFWPAGLLLFAALLAFPLGCGKSEPADLPAPLTPPASVTGAPLFGQEDLPAWTFYLEDPQAKRDDAWTVNDGEVICHGKPRGYLRTLKEYGNYTLSFQWRWATGSRGGNSGLLVHITGEDKIWPQSVEVQLKRDNAGDLYTNETTLEVNDPARIEGERRFINLLDDAEVPIGEWNTMEVTCALDEISVSVNGQLINYASGCPLQRGAIGLQSEGAEIHFRNFRLTPIE